LKQKINPFAAIFVILVVIGVVGGFMYFGSEPPMAHVRARTQEQTAQEAKAFAAGFKSMFDAQAKKQQSEKEGKSAPGKGSETRKEVDTKAESHAAGTHIGDKAAPDANRNAKSETDPAGKP